MRTHVHVRIRTCMHGDGKSSPDVIVRAELAEVGRLHITCDVEEVDGFQARMHMHACMHTQVTQRRSIGSRQTMHVCTHARTACTACTCTCTCTCACTGDEEEVDRFQKTLDMREKGMVYVKGLLEQ